MRVCTLNKQLIAINGDLPMSLFAKAFTQMNEDPELATLENEDAIEAELANEATEIVEAEQTVEEEDTAVEELDGRAETLEEMEETIEQMIADGEGMSRQTAKAYQIAFKGLIGSVLPNPVGTLQSFGADSTRLEATRLTQQGISDTLKKIWEAIKGAVLRAIAAIKDFFAKLFGGATKAKAQLEAIQKKVDEAIKDGYVKKDDGKVKVGNGVRIHVDGKIDAQSVATGTGVAVKQVAEKISDIATGAKAYYDKVAAETKAAKEGSQLNGAQVFKDWKMKTGQHSLPGGKTIVSEVNTGSDDKQERVYIGDHPKKNQFKQNDTVETAPLATLKQIIEGAVSLIDNVDKSKKASEDMVKSRDEAVKAGDALIKQADAGKLSSYWDQAKLRAQLRLSNVSFNSTLSSFSGYSFSTARALGAYVNQHLAGWKKPA